MALRLYFDKMSQPSRALLMFVRITGIPCEEVPIAVRKGEHLSPEFTAKNRFQRVPAIEHNGFQLSESVAIFRYLARTFPRNVQSNWYPKDSELQARVDEYMAWQHIGLRIWGSLYFQQKIILPQFMGKETNQELVKVAVGGIKKSLRELETIWLKDNPYVAGKEISVADLMAVTELEQPGIAGYNVTDGFPKVGEYMERVKNATQPFYDEAHDVVYKARAKFGSKL